VEKQPVCVGKDYDREAGTDYDNLFGVNLNNIYVTPMGYEEEYRRRPRSVFKDKVDLLNNRDISMMMMPLTMDESPIVVKKCYRQCGRGMMCLVTIDEMEICVPRQTQPCHIRCPTNSMCMYAQDSRPVCLQLQDREDIPFFLQQKLRTGYPLDKFYVEPMMLPTQRYPTNLYTSKVLKSFGIHASGIAIAPFTKNTLAKTVVERCDRACPDGGLCIVTVDGYKACITQPTIPCRFRCPQTSICMRTVRDQPVCVDLKKVEDFDTDKTPIYAVELNKVIVAPVHYGETYLRGDICTRNCLPGTVCLRSIDHKEICVPKPFLRCQQDCTLDSVCIVDILKRPICVKTRVVADYTMEMEPREKIGMEIETMSLVPLMVGRTPIVVRRCPKTCGYGFACLMTIKEEPVCVPQQTQPCDIRCPYSSICLYDQERQPVCIKLEDPEVALPFVPLQFSGIQITNFVRLPWMTDKMMQMTAGFPKDLTFPFTSKLRFSSKLRKICPSSTIYAIAKTGFRACVRPDIKCRRECYAGYQCMIDLKMRKLCVVPLDFKTYRITGDRTYTTPFTRRQLSPVDYYGRMDWQKRYSGVGRYNFETEYPESLIDAQTVLKDDRLNDYMLWKLRTLKNVRGPFSDIDNQLPFDYKCTKFCPGRSLCALTEEKIEICVLPMETECGKFCTPGYKCKLTPDFRRICVQPTEDFMKKAFYGKDMNTLTAFNLRDPEMRRYMTRDAVYPEGLLEQMRMNKDTTVEDEKFLQFKKVKDMELKKILRLRQFANDYKCMKVCPGKSVCAMTEAKIEICVVPKVSLMCERTCTVGHECLLTRTMDKVCVRPTMELINMIQAIYSKDIDFLRTTDSFPYGTYKRMDTRYPSIRQYDIGRDYPETLIQKFGIDKDLINKDQLMWKLKEMKSRDLKKFLRLRDYAIDYKCTKPCPGKTVCVSTEEKNEICVLPRMSLMCERTCTVGHECLLTPTMDKVCVRPTMELINMIQAIYSKDIDFLRTADSLPYGTYKRMDTRYPWIRQYDIGRDYPETLIQKFGIDKDLVRKDQLMWKLREMKFRDLKRILRLRNYAIDYKCTKLCPGETVCVLTEEKNEVCVLPKVCEESCAMGRICLFTPVFDKVCVQPTVKFLNILNYIYIKKGATGMNSEDVLPVDFYQRTDTLRRLPLIEDYATEMNNYPVKMIEKSDIVRDIINDEQLQYKLKGRKSYELRTLLRLSKFAYDYKCSKICPGKTMCVLTEDKNEICVLPKVCEKACRIGHECLITPVMQKICVRPTEDIFKTIKYLYNGDIDLRTTMDVSPYSTYKRTDMKYPQSQRYNTGMEYPERLIRKFGIEKDNGYGKKIDYSDRIWLNLAKLNPISARQPLMVQDYPLSDRHQMDKIDMFDKMMKGDFDKEDICRYPICRTGYRCIKQIEGFMCRPKRTSDIMRSIFLKSRGTTNTDLCRKIRPCPFGFTCVSSESVGYKCIKV
jgi:hypothetical protein